MSWAVGRRVLVISIMVAVAAALLAVLAIPFFIHAPTCFDSRQDGTETGVDCGGTCTTLCTAAEAPATVKFVRALRNQNRTDVVAYIDNPNADAYAKGAGITVEVYDENHNLLQKRDLSIDLPPASRTPLFLPGFYQGIATTTEAFITFAQGAPVWQRAQAKAPLPSAGGPQFGTDLLAPKVTGVLTNPTARNLYDTKVVAVIYDAQNTVIGASQTIVPKLSPQGTAALIFTWNQPFLSTPVRAELVTVPTLAP